MWNGCKTTDLTPLWNCDEAQLGTFLTVVYFPGHCLILSTLIKTWCHGILRLKELRYDFYSNTLKFQMLPWEMPDIT